MRPSSLLSISHSQETLASVGEETKEEDRLYVPSVWCFSVVVVPLASPQTLYNPLKVAFSSRFHFNSGRLVLSAELSNLSRQSILGSLAIRKFAIKPYYVDFLLMSPTLIVDLLCSI